MLFRVECAVSLGGKSVREKHITRVFWFLSGSWKGSRRDKRFAHLFTFFPWIHCVELYLPKVNRLNRITWFTDVVRSIVVQARFLVEALQREAIINWLLLVNDLVSVETNIQPHQIWHFGCEVKVATSMMMWFGNSATDLKSAGLQAQIEKEY